MQQKRLAGANGILTQRRLHAPEIYTFGVDTFKNSTFKKISLDN